MRKGRWRAVALVLVLAAVGLLVTLEAPALQGKLTPAANRCLGVEILSAEQAAKLAPLQRDVSRELFYNGSRAPMDTESATVYLSVCCSEADSFYDLAGNLYLDSVLGSLYFLEDAAFDDMDAAIAEGHVFTLLIAYGKTSCVRYNAVFTTLPVMEMTTDSVQEEIVSGTFCMWDPSDASDEGAAVLSERLEWHIRGSATLVSDKKSLKLSVKTSSGESKNVELLGLGSDDDWILNSMNMDDTRLREYLTMAVWNEMAAENEYDPPMSVGEYVELVVDDRYQGVYLLQRRVDRKYLDLEDEILFKGRGSDTPNTAMDVYRIVYSTMDMASTYGAMNTVWADRSAFDLDNFIDITVYLQFGCLVDNAFHKNMFYILEPTQSGYHCRMTPWDTDMGFGLSWKEGYGYVFDRHEEMITYPVTRFEYEDMAALYPDLDERIAARWFELREDVLSWENFELLLDKAESKLCDSGAYARDKAVWGERYDGQDTHEALEQWTWDRLQWCDTFYSP